MDMLTYHHFINMPIGSAGNSQICRGSSAVCKREGSERLKDFITCDIVAQDRIISKEVN